MSLDEINEKIRRARYGKNEWDEILHGNGHKYTDIFIESRIATINFYGEAKNLQTYFFQHVLFILIEYVFNINIMVLFII